MSESRGKISFLIVWVLFLLSGACGLIYEVLWCRQLGLIFGNTVHSLSAVLTAFMGGLALGSFVSGRLCDRIRRPLLVYGVLELLIGFYCWMLPWFFGDNSPLIPFYRSLYGETGSTSLVAARFAVSFVLLLFPTTFMGATLPLLSHYLVKTRTGLGRTVGALYAINSFGAVIGSLLAGFVLLPELGKQNANLVAVVCNLVLGALAVFLGARERSEESLLESTSLPEKTNSVLQASDPAPISPRLIQVVVIAFGITGFAGMATQIGWTRAISLGTGSSTYAFSLIVAVFILGLSFGGSWAARMAPHIADPAGYLGRVLVLIGLLSMTVAAMLGYAPLFFFFLIAWGSESSWSMLLGAQALGIALLIIGPTFFMGASLPLTIQVASRGTQNAGRTVGTVYAVNTLGAIIGSFLGGLLLIPNLQIQNTLKLMALLYALPGLALFMFSASRHDRKSVIGIAAMSVLLLVIGIGGQKWNAQMMSSGMYLLRDPKALKAARELRFSEAVPNYSDTTELLYSKEGAESTVAVLKFGEEISLRVGGKPDASSHGDMTTQMGLTLVPQILHAKGAEHVLVIGLGSGVSVGAALAPNSVKRVDVVEMSPEVVEASAHFQAVNKLSYTQGPHPWIETPKVEVLVNDGRNHLLLTSRKYDVIASEPSNPWMAGVGNLFTKEAFVLCRERLNSGGIMCQWIHSYSLEADQLYSVMKTFGEIFEHVQLWQSRHADYLLIGSMQEIAMPVSRIRTRITEPGTNSWLQRVGWDNEAEFMASFLGHDKSLLLRTRNAPLHTDDNMLLEFQAPRALYHRQRPFRATSFLPLPDPLMNLTEIPPLERGALVRELDLAIIAREHFRYAKEGPGDHDSHMEVAYALDPNQLWAREHFEKKQSAKAQTESAPEVDNPNRNWVDPAIIEFIKTGRKDEALAALDQKLSQMRKNDRAAAPLWAAKAELLSERKQWDNAATAIEKALSLHADNPMYLKEEARILTAMGNAVEAINSLRLRSATVPRDREAKADLVAGFTRAAQSINSQNETMALELLIRARRVCNEICALWPESETGWELLCRTYLAMAGTRQSESDFYSAGARRAYEKLLKVYGGDMKKLPSDLTAAFKL